MKEGGGGRVRANPVTRRRGREPRADMQGGSSVKSLQRLCTAVVFLLNLVGNRYNDTPKHDTAVQVVTFVQNILCIDAVFLLNVGY